jgi:hypothetical protein
MSGDPDENHDAPHGSHVELRLSDESFLLRTSAG